MSRFALVGAVVTCLAIAPAGQAVIILDSTWAEEGGTAANPAAGFGAHIALANQPQFNSTIAIASPDEDFGGCSGTWIGNDAGHAYVLTAAHCFGNAGTQGYRYRSQGGTILRGLRVTVHPEYVDEETTTGFDLAIVKLNAPITDSGPPAKLYGGNKEKGKLLTFMGFGSRGIGSVGQHDDYHDGGSDKAAAQGIVDQVQDGPLSESDRGDYLGVFFPKEDGSIANPYGGSAKPATRFAGLLGSGDSGGSAFLQLGSTWVLAGVNSNGSGKAEYGQSSWFVRVSARRDWIEAITPVARFVD